MLGYGLGDVGFGVYWKTFEVLLLIFYTDVFGITAVQAGTILLVTRLVDAVYDLFIGMLADRTNTRWGKFRPYLLWMSIPLAAAGVMTFTTPDLDGGGKLLYAYATYIFAMMMYSSANIPYGAMLGVITGDVKRRTTVSTVKQVGAFLGGTIFTPLIPKLASVLGQGNAAVGWQRTMMVLGAIAVAMMMVTFAVTRERVTPPPQQKTVIRRDLGDLLRNGPWMTLFALGFVVILTIAIRNNAFAYYIRYYAQVPAADLENVRFWFLLATQAPYAIGAACTPLLSRYFDKKQLFTLLMVAVGLLSGLLFIIPRDALWAMFAVNIGISLVLGPKSVLSWAMFADTADFSEWKTGRRATGLIFSAATFSVKLGGGVAGWVSGQLLNAVGYVPNQEQTSTALTGIVVLSSVIPGACAVAAAGIVRLYSLNGEKLQAIQRDLEARRAQDSSRAPDNVAPGTEPAP